MDVDEIARNGAADIVGTVASAMKEAVAKYGPDAVDLALVAYRVDAIQGLFIGGLCAVALAAIALGLRKFWSISEPLQTRDRDELRAIAMLASAFASIPLAIASFVYLVDAPAWLAALGRPEILIATKALQAAGLM